MTFAQIPLSAAVFLDANVLIYHFTADAKYGTACTQLLKRIEHQQLHGFTSSHVMGDVAHRLMTIEAIALFGWPATGIAARLRKQHGEIGKLKGYFRAVSEVPRLGVQVLSITQAIIESATVESRINELLTNDALVVAVMHAHVLNNLGVCPRISACLRF